jgi:hypothetical protein
MFNIIKETLTCMSLYAVGNQEGYFNVDMIFIHPSLCVSVETEEDRHTLTTLILFIAFRMPGMFQE